MTGVIPIVSMTTVRKWGRGKHLYPLVTAFAGPELNPIHAQVQQVQGKSHKESAPQTSLFFFSMHGVPIPISKYMLLSSSPPIHLLIEEGRIKSALESQGSLSQRRECLNQDTKGVWALPATHQDGAERKEHAKACLRSYKEFDALRASNTARTDL